MNRSCQRQTHVLDLPVHRMISFVPIPVALSRTISARQTCFWAALRSLTSVCNRLRSGDERMIEMPVRMHQTRMRTPLRESQTGFKCQICSTRSLRMRFAKDEMRQRNENLIEVRQKYLS